MKIKGINPFERNVEKIVLGAVAAVFLAVLALQFIRQPNMITVEGKTVPPQDAYRDLEQRAQAMISQMQSVEPPPPPQPGQGSQDLLARFKTSMEGDVAPSTTLAWHPPGLNLGIKDAGATTGGGPGQAIAEVMPPAPTAPLANVTGAAIDPGEVADSPELAALLPAQQPYDKEAVTVEASFDGTALRAAFMADPDGAAGASPMPSGWWQGAVQVLGCRLEREELASTGEWTNTTMVAHMPGRDDLVARAESNETTHKSELDAISAAAGAAPDQARRPEYYRMIAGPTWVAPREASAAMQTGGNQPKIDRLRASKADKEGQIADLEEQLKTATDGKGAPPTGPDRGEIGGGKGHGGGQGGGGAPTQDTKKPSKAELERRIKNLKDQVGRADQELKDLGDESVAPGAAPGAAPKAKALLDDPAVRVWAHDVTAEPGKTYHYRLRVVVNNPAFDRAAFISADQAKFAGAPVLYSAPSDWTAPVTVDATECYFIVGASAGGEGPLGGTHATAEVYKFYYGFWRQGKVNLEPGDLLATTAKLPELFTYDMAKLGQPPAEPNNQEPLGGGREAGRVTPPDHETDAAANLPGQVPLPRELPILIDAVLLDVARMPGGLVPEANRLASGEAPNQALLRDGSGQVVARTPELDRTSDAYERVSRSAKDGLTQGVPPTPKASEQGDQSKKRPGELQPQTPKGGKGGGEGGGGGGGG